MKFKNIFFTTNLFNNDLQKKNVFYRQNLSLITKKDSLDIYVHFDYCLPVRKRITTTLSLCKESARKAKYAHPPLALPSLKKVSKLTGSIFKSPSCFIL